ncbi:MAG: site-specific DNA-methyltransferase [Prevotella sp.]|nr:site-specific DNA-methyltransferase [Candidatus Prevotella equi]
MLDFGFYNMDCMEGMKEFPDNYFDLAIVDPPYGIGVGSMAYTNGVAIVGGKCKARRKDYSGHKLWDTQPPSKEYFTELFRVSKRQIIWGGNYFTDNLPPTKSWIVWDKRCEEKMSNDFADCELAWCSNGVARVFRYLYNGMLQGDMKNKEARFHPTQKPVQLYEWLLNKYAKDGDIILDTHVGSASSLVACHKTRHKFVGFELDPEYYERAKERLDAEMAQISIFDFMEGDND